MIRTHRSRLFVWKESPALHELRRLSPEEFSDSLDALAGLLVDAVESGASVGFLAPLSRDTARAWWSGRRQAVADGTLAVFACCEGADIIASVGLAGAAMPNAPHRAEIVKLIVHRSARGRGLARELLRAVEAAAAAQGATLLVLDTETGSPAERLYLTGGWTRYGVVPAYAATPDGTPRDCSFFYKRIDSPT